MPENFRGRLRRYLPTALIPNVVAVLTVIVVALAVLLLASVEMAALPATIAQFWLILNLVPVSYEGATIGLLPMVPALILVWLIARQVHKAVKDRVSVADLGVLLVCILVVPLVLTGIAAGMLWDASAVYEVAPPEIPVLLARVVALHLVAMVIGMGTKLWRALCRRYGLPEALVDNARTAARWFSYLGLAALVVLLVAMVLGWNRQAELVELYNGAGALVALGVVCLLYLPNALIGAAAVLVGGEFHLGEASVSLFSIHHTPLPPVPLVAAIPAESQVWFPILLIIPAALATYLAYRSSPSLLSAVTTGFFAGICMLVAGYFAQGTLGAFGPSGPMVLLSAALVFVWLTLAGVATALLLKLAERRQSRAEQLAESAPAAATETDQENTSYIEDLEESEDADPEPDEAEDPGETEVEDSEETPETPEDPESTEADGDTGDPEGEESPDDAHAPSEADEDTTADPATADESADAREDAGMADADEEPDGAEEAPEDGEEDDEVGEPGVTEGESDTPRG